MSKKQITLIIIFAAVVSLFGNVFFGRFLAAKLSTWPLLNRWKLLSPEAPIVINTRQEVRMNDTADVQQAGATVRSKLALVVSNAGGQLEVLGGGFNLTSDGYVVTTKTVVGSQKTASLMVKMDDGSIFSVSQQTVDNASGAVILKTSATNLAVANLASSESLVAGQRLIFASPELSSYSVDFAAGFVSQAQTGDGGVKDADSSDRTFSVQGSAASAAGAVAADTFGNVVGLWDGSQIISSDVLKDLSANFLGHQGTIVHPAFGFHYRAVSPAEAAALSVPQGIEVTAVAAGGPAQKAGLEAGDIIQSWNRNSVGDSSAFEELLAQHKPGDAVVLQLTRGKNQSTVNLTAGQLK